MTLDYLNKQIALLQDAIDMPMPFSDPVWERELDFMAVHLAEMQALRARLSEDGA
jgi:hypothetical protein